MKLLDSRYGGLLLLAAGLLLLPWLAGNAYLLDVANRIAINAIIAVGLNLLIGYAGQISLGHAGFLGLGAYASAILCGRYDWPAWLALLSAAAGVALLAFLVARPILRLQGHYLAMATLGLGMIVSLVLSNESALTGGPDGMAVPGLVLFGWEPQGERAWYWIFATLLLLAIWLAQNLIDSPLGRALRAVHGSEVAARVAGVDTTACKVQVFVISAVFAAIAGSLSAHYTGFVTPGQASFLHSVELVTMVVIGGMASTYGAVLGAALMTLLPQLLSGLEDYEMLVFGLILMVSMIVLPQGLLPGLRGWLQTRRAA